MSQVLGQYHDRGFIILSWTPAHFWKDQICPSTKCYFQREGQLKLALRIFGYLKAYAKAKIGVETSFSDPHGEVVNHDWVEFYKRVEEEIRIGHASSLREISCVELQYRC